MKNPNAMRVVKHVQEILTQICGPQATSFPTIDGIRACVETYYADALATQRANSPAHNDDEDDYAAVFLNVAVKYGDDIALCVLQQGRGLPRLSSLNAYVAWAVEMNESRGSDRSEIERLQAENARLRNEVGRLRGNTSR